MKPSPAMVVALLALFISLGGVGYAAATGSIGSREIRNGSVSTDDVRDGSLTAADARADAFGGVVVREEQLDARKLNARRLGVVPAARDVTANGIDASDIAPNAVRSPEVASRAVGSDELDDTVRRFGRNEKVAAGRTVTAKISCKKEEQLLSGGGRWGNPSLEKVAIQSSFSAGKNWTAIGVNNSDSTQAFQAFALCLTR